MDDGFATAGIAQYSLFFILARQMFFDSESLNIGTRRWNKFQSFPSVHFEPEYYE